MYLDYIFSIIKWLCFDAVKKPMKKLLVEIYNSLQAIPPTLIPWEVPKNFGGVDVLNADSSAETNYDDHEEETPYSPQGNCVTTLNSNSGFMPIFSCNLGEHFYY